MPWQAAEDHMRSKFQRLLVSLWSGYPKFSDNRLSA
jgi:hypothetical protein